jgi:REP element-mobilizing transposase RayT
MVRGVERRSIFRADIDRLDFLQRLGKGLIKTGTSCFTWALMTNHLHLFILSGVQGLAALMHPLLTGYVGAFNRRYRRVGHLVQNRFKAILCEEDPYWLELVRYIPLNPVRAGLVKTPEALARYPWTGHAAILGKVIAPWQNVDEVLGRFGGQRAAARKAYETFVVDAWNQGERKDLEGGGLLRSLGGLEGVRLARSSGHRESFDSQVLGGGDFVEEILRKAERAEEQQEALSRAGLTLDSLQTFAAQAIGVNSAALVRHDRSKPAAEAKALFIYAATEILKKSSASIASLLGMSSSSISEARQRGWRLGEKYRFLETLNAAFLRK